LAGISLVSPALAVVNMNWTSIGNVGNAADTIGYGSVDHAYKIGTYEVTNAQYVDFLNAKGGSNSNGIYSSNMAGYGIAQTGSSGSYTYSVTSGLGNRPVVYVSWYDAARFTNWLGNGQGGGSMETGAYTLSGNTGIITVNPGATVYLPSENEWYKAAYYSGGTSTYSLYPNGQNTITTADANYSGSGSTDVGIYSGDPSSYGTFDQGGNVWEWNDAVISGPSRGLRGGSWHDGGGLQSSNRGYGDPSYECNLFGFRVASSELAAVPEPTTLLSTLALVSSGLLLRRRGKVSL